MKLAVRTLAGVALVATSFFVLAQTMPLRMLPENAKKGEMASADNWKVVIDGKTHPMAPGIRIRDVRNILVTPAGIKGPSKVRYTFDPMGNVDNVWILTPEEAALPEPKK